MAQNTYIQWYIGKHMNKWKPVVSKVYLLEENSWFAKHCFWIQYNLSKTTLVFFILFYFVNCYIYSTLSFFVFSKGNMTYYQSGSELMWKSSFISFEKQLQNSLIQTIIADWVKLQLLNRNITLLLSLHLGDNITSLDKLLQCFMIYLI